MKLSFSFLILALSIGILQVIADQNGVARYDHYRLYYVKLTTNEHVEIYQRLEANGNGIETYQHARRPGQNIFTMVAAHRVADFEDLLTRLGMENTVLSYNFQEKINRNYLEVMPKLVPAFLMGWNHYYHLDTINNWLKLKVAAYPNILSLVDIGTSYEGQPMLGVKLSHNPANKAIFLESGIHANEWITPATATYIINELLTSRNPAIKQLAQNYNWFIFPVLNPDGYKYTFEKDRMWRKNRAPHGMCRGADLNRNFPFQWNLAYDDSCPHDYPGPSPASEQETQNMINFLEANVETEQIRTFLSLHSFSQLIMFPYGYTNERVEHYDDLSLIAKKAAETIKQLSGRTYYTGSIFETIYTSTGNSKDYAYANLNISMTFSFELRGPPNTADIFLLPANEIRPCAEETMAAIVTIIEQAQQLGYYD